MVLISGLMINWWQNAPSFHHSELELQRLDKDTYEVLYLKIPSSSKYGIMPVVSDRLELLPDLMGKVKDSAIAGINAGFFDPANKQTTSFVIGQGTLLANPVDNRNFVENPDLFPYITNMLNRSEFRVLDCNGKRQYVIAKHRDAVKSRCKLIHSMQAGPNLFDPKSVEEEAFIAHKNGKRIRDPLGVDRKNARSAVGIDAEGNVIMAMVAMKPLETEPSGATLREMADIMRELGARQALSLDGGSSSTLWACGQTFYGKLDNAFNPIKRPIKSALVVIREE
jgi:exopolysaccharide biosynthesis protein